jgi:hypothetical protein
MEFGEFVEKGMMFRILAVVMKLVFLLNRIEDLPLLMVLPDHRQYFCGQVLMLEASLRLALPKISRSSAKRRWLMAGLFLEIFNLLMFPRDSSLKSSLERTSEPKIKRKGER